MADGTKTAVELALAAAGQDLDECEPELDLGLPVTAAGRALADAKRGRGRPPGSRNKRTRQTVDRLLSQYQDPRAVLLAIAQTPVDELAAALGCDAKEALQEKRLAAIGVLPYVAQRQPLAVDITDRKVVHLTIVDGGVAPAASTDVMTITGQVVDLLEGDAQIIENQSVSGDDDDAV